MAKLIVSTITLTYYAADLAGQWPQVHQHRVLHHFGAGANRYAVMTIPGSGPRYPTQMWNSRVIVEGLVGIMLYMLREGFRLNEAWIIRATSGESGRSSLGGFKFMHDPEA